MQHEAQAGDLQPGDRIVGFSRMGKWKKVDFSIAKIEGDRDKMLVITGAGTSFQCLHLLCTVPVRYERKNVNTTNPEEGS